MSNSSHPHMDYNGAQSGRLPDSQASTPSAATHIPLVFITSEKGDVRPRLKNILEVKRHYGEEFLNSGSIHYTHPNRFLENALSSQGTKAIVKRIVFPEATKSSLRLSLEVIPTIVPIYNRDSYGFNIEQINRNTGEITHSVIDTTHGHRFIWHVTEIPTDSNGFSNASAVIDYRQGSTQNQFGEYLGVMDYEGPTHSTSKLYPIMDLEYSFFGSHGNKVAIEIQSLLDSVSFNPDHLDFNDSVPIPYVLRFKELGDLTYRAILTEENNEEVLIHLDRNVVDNSTWSNYLNISEYLKSKYGEECPIGRAHIYHECVDDVRDAVVNGRSYTFGGDTYSVDGELDFSEVMRSFGLDERFQLSQSLSMVDLVTLRYYNQNPYFTVLNDGDRFDGKDIAPGIFHLLQGGDDGYALDSNGEVDKLATLRMFDELVGVELTSFSQKGNDYSNIVRFPFRVFYDSGYSMATKLLMLNIHKSRPEVLIYHTPYSVADWVGVDEPPLIISCDGAVENSGCIALTGEWDVVIDGVRQNVSLDEAGLINFLNTNHDLSVQNCEES